MKRFLLTLGVLCYATVAQAATYYVSDTSGDDARSCATAQSIGTPKKTIGSVIQCATSPDDRVEIRAGTYIGAENEIDTQRYTISSGTSGHPITIAAYRTAAYPAASEAVTIQPSDQDAALRLNGIGSWLVFQDIVFDCVYQVTDVTGQCAYIAGSGASNNVFQRIEVKNGNNFGVQITNNGGNAVNNQFLQCSVHDNGSLGFPNTNGHGFYIQTTDTIVDGCDVYNNKGMGIQVNCSGCGTGGTSRTLIKNGRAFNNAVRTTTTGVNITIAFGTDVLVYNELVYQTTGQTNLAGIQCYTGTVNCQVFNNTIFGHLWDGFQGQYFSSAPVLRNNIFWGNTNDIDDMGGGSGPLTQDHNLFVTSNPVSYTPLTSSNPLFVSSGGGNFHLQAGSPALDVGVTIGSVVTDADGNSRPQGSAYDLGAFERPSGSAPAAPTGLTITASALKNSLGWSSSSGATSYNIKRSETSSVEVLIAIVGSSGGYDDMAVIPGRTYYYVITASNGSGESGNSNEASGAALFGPRWHSHVHR